MIRSLIRKTILGIGILAAGALSSCKSEDFDLFQGSGRLELNVKSDLAPIKVITSKADTPIIYHVQILDKNNAIVASYADHTQIPASIELKAGTYTIKAFNQETEADGGFNKPYYAGQAQCVIKSSTTTTTQVVCSLANVKVSVSFDKNVKDNFTQYTATITNRDNGSLIFNEQDTTAGYLKNTGSLKWTLSLVNSNGTTYTLEDTISNVEARQYYILKFNVNTTGSKTKGGINTLVTVDPTLYEQSHNINIILNPKSKPQIAGTGFDIDSPVQVNLGTAATYEVSFLAEAKISDITMNHSSTYLSSLGIPTTFSLVNGSSTTAAQIQAKGITWTSPIADATTAHVSLSTLFASLPLGTYPLTFEILDSQNQLVAKTIQVNVVPDVDVTTVSVKDNWAKFATVTGQWNTIAQPSGIGFAYKKTSDAAWTTVTGSAISISGKTFTTTLTGLNPSSNYQVKAISTTEENANIIPFSTEAAASLNNLNFDTWGSSTSPSGVWCTGNNTFANMTTQEGTTVQGGSGSAAKLASQEVKVLTVRKFAAGNIFTGSGFKVSGMGGEMDFGVPYTSRPTSLSGYYHYTPGTIDSYAVSPYTTSGQLDYCCIYAILTKWSAPFHVNTNTATFINLNDTNIIAYGELTSNEATNGYKAFKIDLKYRNTTDTPTYIVIVATASKYGDYFSGATSSVLYVDNFSLGFDAPIVRQ